MDKDKIRCVIFDCDGTLVDSERLSCQALVQVFASYGAEICFDECMAHFQGGKMFDVLKETSNRAGLTIPMDILEPKYRQCMRQLFDEKLKPVSSALETVQYLIDKGIAVCVASNGSTNKMEHSLALTGMLPLFKNKIFSAFDINSWKPEPDLLMYTAMQMGFLIEECLFVDDTENGVWAGINANIKTIHYCPNNTHNIVHPLVEYIQDLSELKAYF
ncbi:MULTISPECIES: HAD-IA family hydrolase [Vibrio]|uniref:HAD family hydrolase n=1 Tax=Vibrio casei TaxID=673372 RepID=A0A368LHS8_9VIBR|nr:MULTISPECIES: HAD-IA family hydrolase [Vibrio]RCS70302.1 HAD family hydrolase [Vibrio casei]SJN19787.1 Putative phosphatase YieH [Vibrio casei]HBV77367.1 HAD family hydrolase [Vibrio sp.]